MPDAPGDDGARRDVIWPQIPRRGVSLRGSDARGGAIGRISDTVSLGGGRAPTSPALLASIPADLRHRFASRAGEAWGSRRERRYAVMRSVVITRGAGALYRP